MKAARDPENARIDALVLQAISIGCGFAGGISSSMAISYRAVDRSLQRLRKSGRIVYEHGSGWGLSKTQGPTCKEA